jgi:O-acetyl-ADP-ribose deacetylase (regulator of RNase III)
VDGIVNVANEGLLGGGGIDEAVHKAAGPLSQFECALKEGLTLRGSLCITHGYQLPAHYVIHTVAPYLDEQGQPQPSVLRSSYESILELASQSGLRTVAIPCIGTGFYGYPLHEATKVAVQVITDWVQRDISFEPRSQRRDSGSILCRLSL